VGWIGCFGGGGGFGWFLLEAGGLDDGGLLEDGEEAMVKIFVASKEDSLGLVPCYRNDYRLTTLPLAIYQHQPSLTSPAIDYYKTLTKNLQQQLGDGSHGLSYHSE